MKHDLRKFCLSQGVNMSVFDSYHNPYILEERDLHVTQLDVFSRLMIDRQIFFTGEVNDDVCSIMIAQLLYLDSIGNEDITINIASPGGSVSAGMGLVDTIGKIKSDVRTVNLSSAYSMGLVLLVSGKRGKRVALPHSRILLHQPLGGAKGPCDDVLIEAEQMKLIRDDLFEFIGMRTGHTKEEISLMAPRDRWMDAKESLDNGFIDSIETVDWTKK